MLVEKAKAGEPWAVRELLDRVLGKAQAASAYLPRVVCRATTQRMPILPPIAVARESPI